MSEEDKIKVFEKEYLYIKSDDLVSDAKYLIGHLPDYFFKVDASSTGKYHPKYAAGDGGLSRHVKSACKFETMLLYYKLNLGGFRRRRRGFGPDDDLSGHADGCSSLSGEVGAAGAGALAAGPLSAQYAAGTV